MHKTRAIHKHNDIKIRGSYVSMTFITCIFLVCSQNAWEEGGKERRNKQQMVKNKNPTCEQLRQRNQCEFCCSVAVFVLAALLFRYFDYHSYKSVVVNTGVSDWLHFSVRKFWRVCACLHYARVCVCAGAGLSVNVSFSIDYQFVLATATTRSWYD